MYSDTFTVTSDTAYSLTTGPGITVADLFPIDSTADAYFSNIKYNFDFENFPNLLEKTKVYLNIGLTCSHNPSEVVTHSLVAHGANPLPSWVSLDSANSRLVIDTPSGATATYFVAVSTQFPA